MVPAIRQERPLSIFNEMLNEFFEESFYNRLDREISQGLWPRVDITEQGDSYVIKADVPGVEKDDISISIEGGMLSISGEIKGEMKQEKGSYAHLERQFGHFYRSFNLPQDVDASQVAAHCRNGVLEITLKRRQPSHPRAVEVKID
jgi:HSP20 family protein